MKVLTLVNQKGGTGKTTLAALIGLAFALEFDKKVLLIDLDPQAHLTSLFISRPEQIRSGIFELVAEGEAVEPIHIVRSANGSLDLIPSRLEYIIYDYKGKIPSFQSTALDLELERRFSRYYDLIICDCPPQLHYFTVMAIVAADFILIPSTLDEFSYQGIRIFLSHVLPERIRTYKDPVKVLGIVLTNVLVGRHGTLIAKFRERISKDLRKIVKDVAPDVRSRLLDALPFLKIGEDPVLNSFLVRDPDLTDLVFRPKRMIAPVIRVYKKNDHVKSCVNSIAREVLDRMDRYF